MVSELINLFPKAAVAAASHIASDCSDRGLLH